MRIQKAPEPDYPGISLRQLERTDLSAWYAYLSRDEVVQHTSWDLKAAEDLLPLFEGIESTSAASLRRLAIVSEASGALIGTIGFHTISEINRSAEIAYDLAPGNWGRGVASAVCAAITRWAFIEYGFVRIQGTVLETNSGSARVLEKCGFHYEGMLRSYRMVRGSPGNLKLYSALNTD